MKYYDNGIFEDDYRVSFAQMNRQGVLSNKYFLALMQDIAGEHSAFMHITFSDIAKDNLTWVILSWNLKVYKRPGEDETIKIKTYVRDMKKAFLMRDFRVYNEKDELCAIATSKWCLVNFLTGKIARMPENIESLKIVNNPVFEEDVKLEEPEGEAIYSDIYRIRRFDLDNNKHVHNLNYINFAYELLPEEIYDKKEYVNMAIDFKHEIKMGQKINSFLYKESKGYTVVIRNEENTLTHAIVRLY